MCTDLQPWFRELADLDTAQRERRWQDVPSDTLRQELRELLAHDAEEDLPLHGTIAQVAAGAFDGSHWTGAMAGSYRLGRLLGTVGWARCTWRSAPTAW